MNVLSLFDGISCGKLALQRAGIKVDKYYASEIDALAMDVSKKNHDDIIQLGDVTKWKDWSIDWCDIDLVIGGSPCQGFSSSGKGMNFEDPRSKLFFLFVDILGHIQLANPNVLFFLENVKMKPEWSSVITQYLNVNPVEINSKYFSAQNRVRLYWCNFQIPKYEDRGILLKDIVEDDYIHSAAKRTRPIVSENHRKSLCLEVNGIEKSMCLVTVMLNNLLSPLPKGRYIDVNSKSYPYREMTIWEMERLQTLPKGYVGGVSVIKAAKLLGNAWNVDTVAHAFTGI